MQCIARVVGTFFWKILATHCKLTNTWYVNYLSPFLPNCIPFYLLRSSHATQERLSLKNMRLAFPRKKTFGADLITAEDFNFAVRVNNGCGATTIIGSTWKEFARAYQLEGGMEVSFTINKPGMETTVRSSRPPIICCANLHFLSSYVAWIICLVNF